MNHTDPFQQITWQPDDPNESAIVFYRCEISPFDLDLMPQRDGTCYCEILLDGAYVINPFETSAPLPEAKRQLLAKFHTLLIQWQNQINTAMLSLVSQE